MKSMADATVDGIWQRALEETAQPDRAGDLALRVVLRAHGLIMSGGLERLFEVLSPADVVLAAGGYVYLNLVRVSEIVVEASLVPADSVNGVRWMELNNQYSAEIPRDEVLVERLKRLASVAPHAFAPLDRGDPQAE